MRINIARLGTPVSADREQLLLSLLRQMYDQPTARERRRIVDVLDDAIGMTVAHPPVIPSPEGREEVRIVPAIGGVQVAYGLCVGRTFPAIRDLCIVSDRPLYIADLPRDECDYYSQEVVVYGVQEFGGPECVSRVHGVIGDNPVFTGFTREDGASYAQLVFDPEILGTQHQTQHQEISDDSVRLMNGSVVYAARSGRRWRVYVDGQPRGSRFDEEPTIRVLEYAHPLVPSLSGTMSVNRLSISGRRNRRSRTDILDFSSQIAKRLRADS